MKRRTSERGRQDFRALTPFDKLGPEHETLLVEDDASAPHLRAVEYAVIDTSDREPQHGELFAILRSNAFGEGYRQIAQLRRSYVNVTGPGAAESLVWWLSDLRGFRKTDQTYEGVPVFTGLTDGPYLPDGLKQMVAGRIVGIAKAPRSKEVQS